MQPDRVAETAGRDVSRETMQRLRRYVDLLLAENKRQNLIARSTEVEVFERHILDSAQLLTCARLQNGHWVDIGTGPGLPGIILALLTTDRFTLVEPRPLRTAFLERVLRDLRLDDRVTIVKGKAADAQGAFDVITGRAVANLHRFLTLSHHLSTEKTRWILPKGRKAAEELDEARRFWHFDASMVPSVTDAAASIICIDRVRPKRRGGKR